MPQLPDNFAFMTQGQKDDYFKNVPTPPAVSSPQAPAGPAVISSSMGKTIVDETKTKFDTFKAGLDNAQKIAEGIKADQAKKDQELALVNAKNSGTAALFGGGTGTGGGSSSSSSSTSTTTLSADSSGVVERAAQAEKDLNALLDPMKGQLDAAKNQQIESIKSKYAQLRQKMEVENARRNKQQETIGVRFGGRYAIEHTADLVTEQVQKGIERIGEINSMESQEITMVQSAFDAKSYSLALEGFDRLEKIREKKNAELASLEKIQVEGLKKIQEEQKKSDQDEAIGSLMADGITDPLEIMAGLKKGGFNVTAKDIKDAITNLSDISPDAKNIFEIQKEAAKNGASREMLRAIGSSTNVNDAFAAAGDSLAEMGSGIIGEYNLYKKQAEAAGQQPILFRDYKDWDDNNKKSIAAAGVANEYGLDKEQRTRTYALMDDYDKQTKDIKTVISSSSQIDALSSLALSSNKDKGSRAAAQIGTIFSFMKMLDPTSTVREGEYATAQNTAGVDDKIRNAYNKARDGSFLQDAQINGYVSTAKALAKSRSRNLEEINKEFDRRGELSGIPAGTISVAMGKTAGELVVQSEDQAKVAVDSFYQKAAPDVKSSVKTLIAKGFTNAEVMEYLKSKNLMQ